MKHILFDLKDCPSELLDNEEFVRLSVWTAAKKSKSELLDTVYRFENFIENLVKSLYINCIML